MPRASAKKKPQNSHRRANVARHITLDPEADAILQAYCPLGSKGRGKFVAELLHRYEATRHERHRLRQQLKGMSEGEENNV